MIKNCQEKELPKININVENEDMKLKKEHINCENIKTDIQRDVNSVLDNKTKKHPQLIVLTKENCKISKKPNLDPKLANDCCKISKLEEAISFTKSKTEIEQVKLLNISESKKESQKNKLKDATIINPNLEAPKSNSKELKLKFTEDIYITASNLVGNRRAANVKRPNTKKDIDAGCVEFLNQQKILNGEKSKIINKQTIKEDIDHEDELKHHQKIQTKEEIKTSKKNKCIKKTELFGKTIIKKEAKIDVEKRYKIEHFVNKKEKQPGNEFDAKKEEVTDEVILFNEKTKTIERIKNCKEASKKEESNIDHKKSIKIDIDDHVNKRLDEVNYSNEEEIKNELRLDEELNKGKKIVFNVGLNDDQCFEIIEKHCNKNEILPNFILNKYLNIDEETKNIEKQTFEVESSLDKEDEIGIKILNHEENKIKEIIVNRDSKTKISSNKKEKIFFDKKIFFNTKFKNNDNFNILRKQKDLLRRVIFVFLDKICKIEKIIFYLDASLEIKFNIKRFQYAIFRKKII